MKTMKKFLTLFLSLIMVLAMGITAFAAGNGSITIDNAVEGETYTIYRIFDLESYNTTAGTYAYKVTNEKWEEFVTTGEGAVYIKLSDDKQGYVTWNPEKNTEQDWEDFAKKAMKFAKDENLVNQGSKKATTTTVVFDNLDLGYYLVDTSLGSLCSLDTTNPTVKIEEKNEKPEIEKKVEEDSKTGDTAWGENNDADINQTVNFKAEITAKKGAQNYVMHDSMSAGLDFKQVERVTLNGVDVATSNYIVDSDKGFLCKESEGADKDCDFHVTFNQTFLDNLKDNDKIVVYYSATVNKNAVVGGDGNSNDVKLEYGDESETTWKNTITYVWEMNIFKHTTTGEGEAAVDSPLAGAQFILYKTVDSVNYYAQIAEGKLTGWTTTEADATTLTSPTDGFIYIDGLDADTYYLKETKAPDGYNIMSPNPKEIAIKADGTIDGSTTIGEDEDKVDNVIKVLNQSGSELPSTGGIGTTIFYVVGSVLMIGAVILLVTKKKMSADK